MKPYVGQTVKLNHFGMTEIGGLRSEEEIYQALNMTITKVTKADVTGNKGDALYDIEVDQPLINRFMLTSDMVDPIWKGE